jgi:DNA-binding transcriptional regulator YdaS (Cro superfamily)
MNLTDYLEKNGVTQDALALRLGVTQSAVSQWMRSRVPAERVLAVVSATGGAVQPHELRPDIYTVDFHINQPS